MKRWDKTFLVAIVITMLLTAAWLAASFWLPLPEAAREAALNYGWLLAVVSNVVALWIAYHPPEDE